jgi:CRISPR-associated endonuclease Cas1
MKATKTVAQSPRVHKSTQAQSQRQPAAIHFRRLFAPGHHVVVLVGFGIKVRVDRGHLILEDGIGNDRREGRFPRVHHGLSRIVIIGNDGMVSLAALQWLADQNIAFVMLERNGTVLLTTGPVAASDTRLRRAQACAQHSRVAVEIVRELIRLKVSGQESVAREKLGNLTAGDAIASIKLQLDGAESIDTLRMLEGHAAGVYWTAWQSVRIQFPKTDLSRIPEHWQTFGTRRSLISGTSRRPPNPVNAILNYLYTLLESETRLAITALGLDPGFGLLHVDHATRDSLVYDLMEPVRPKIDGYVLDWILKTPLKRSWFFEHADGCCRLMSDLTVELSDTAPTWSREVAPIVEWFAQTLSSASADNARVRSPGTRLTQRRRYEGAGASMPTTKQASQQQNVCEACGAAISVKARYCGPCAAVAATQRITEASGRGRLNAVTAEALGKRSRTMSSHRDAIRNWQPADLPSWLDDTVYTTKIQPILDRLSKAAIAKALGVTKDYAYEIARGDKIPHRRHWVKLADLAGVGPNGNRSAPGRA